MFCVQGLYWVSTEPETSESSFEKQKIWSYFFFTSWKWEHFGRCSLFLKALSHCRYAEFQFSRMKRKVVLRSVLVRLRGWIRIRTKELKGNRSPSVRPHRDRETGVCVCVSRGQWGVSSPDVWSHMNNLTLTDWLSRRRLSAFSGPANSSTFERRPKDKWTMMRRKKRGRFSWFSLWLMNGTRQISQTDGCEAAEASIRRRGSSSAANQVLPQLNEESR